MSKHSDQVVAGFMRLSPSEQAEAVEEINKYINSNQKNLVMESFIKSADMDLGPIGTGGCRCCGK